MSAVIKSWKNVLETVENLQNSYSVSFSCRSTPMKLPNSFNALSKMVMLYVAPKALPGTVDKAFQHSANKASQTDAVIVHTPGWVV